MRLARLAAVGLAIGVIAGFAIALLRPRPQKSPPGTSPGDRVTAGSSADDQLWDQFQKAERASTVELRSARRVTG
jgi:hypothetical protein